MRPPYRSRSHLRATSSPKPVSRELSKRRIAVSTNDIARIRTPYSCYVFTLSLFGYAVTRSDRGLLALNERLRSPSLALLSIDRGAARPNGSSPRRITSLPYVRPDRNLRIIYAAPSISEWTLDIIVTLYANSDVTLDILSTLAAEEAPRVASGSLVVGAR